MIDGALIRVSQAQVPDALVLVPPRFAPPAHGG